MRTATAIVRLNSFLRLVCFSLTCIIAVLPIQNSLAQEVFSNFEETNLRQLRQDYGALNQALVNPLRKEAIREYKAKNFVKAVDHLRALQHMVHRDEGVWSLKQAAYLNLIANAELAMLLTEDSDTTHKFHYKVHQHNFEPDAPEMIEPTLKLAEWLSFSAQYNDATRLYKAALKLIERHDMTAKFHSRALRGLGETTYLKSSCCVGHLFSKAADLTATDGTSDSVTVAKAYLDAADINLMLGNIDQSHTIYQRANLGIAADQSSTTPRMLGEVNLQSVMNVYRPELKRRLATTNHDKLNRKRGKSPVVQLVGSPMPICVNELKTEYGLKKFTNLKIDFQFVVDTSGRARDIKIVETNAPRRINRLLSRMIKLYKFRPGFKDGVATDQLMRVKQTFEPAKRNINSIAELAAAHACNSLAAI